MLAPAAQRSSQASAAQNCSHSPTSNKSGATCSVLVVWTLAFGHYTDSILLKSNLIAVAFATVVVFVHDAERKDMRPTASRMQGGWMVGGSSSETQLGHSIKHS